MTEVLREWESEPDRRHWVDAATGLDCLIVRGPTGALCGYVGVPSGHPWYGRLYDEVDADVHGGLTYSSECAGHICHSAEKGDSVAREDVWWLGFDCAHLGDYCPGHYPLPIRTREAYRNIAYVEGECRRLASQVKGAAA